MPHLSQSNGFILKLSLLLFSTLEAAELLRHPHYSISCFPTREVWTQQQDSTKRKPSNIGKDTKDGKARSSKELQSIRVGKAIALINKQQLKLKPLVLLKLKLRQMWFITTCYYEPIYKVEKGLSYLQFRWTNWICPTQKLCRRMC